MRIIKELECQQTGHQLPSSAETYQQWHTWGINVCYKMLKIAKKSAELIAFLGSECIFIWLKWTII